MDLEKQKLLLGYLISSVDTFAICTSIIKPEYFDPELSNSVKFIQDYYEKYTTTPDCEQISTETGVELKYKKITTDKISYCTNEIETFCKHRALEKAIIYSANLIGTDKAGKIEEIIKEATAIGLTKDLGLDYFKDPLARLNLLDSEEAPQPTLWTEFDRILNGGIVKKQMTLFSANSGGGKSIVMLNLGVNLLKQRCSVLYITLELSEGMVSLRHDSVIAGTPQATWRERKKETATKIEAMKNNVGSFFVKYMPSGTNCNVIKAYLKEFELTNGYVPDALIVDYLDLMGSNDPSSKDNVFEKDKQVAEQLRNLGTLYDMHIITASQQNRSAVGATELNHSHIAGGLSKINTTDNYISIIQSDAMRSSGEVAFTFLKTRSSDGVGKTIQLKWDTNTLAITNPDGIKSNNPLGDNFAKLNSVSKASPSGNTLLDLFNDTTG